MPQLELRAALLAARANKTPILAFNVVDFASLLGVLEASEDARAPVICQYSARTVAFYGATELAALTRQAAERLRAVAYVHLDHCTDASILEACIEAGFDGVMFDGSSLPIEENIRQSNLWRQRTESRGIALEAEFSAIAGEEDGHSGASSREPLDEEAFRVFVRATRPDIIGADIGTYHGHYIGGEPAIDFELLQRLSGVETTPFVIHGGSGLSPDTIRRISACGVAKLNISTDLKDAWRRGMHDAPDGEPLASIKAARLSVRDLCISKWESFSRRNT